MQRIVSFNRKIRLSHLDAAWRQVLATGDVSAAMLDDMMSVDIRGANRRAKAASELHELLTGPSTSWLVHRAVELSRGSKLSDDDRLAMYWSLFLPAFPFVREAWGVMGRLSRLEPQFSRRAYTQRLSEIYGGGRAVVISIEEVLGMTKDWGVIIMDRPGFYHVAPQRTPSKNVQRLLLVSLCLTANPPVYPLSRFADELALFPFKLHLSIADLRHKNSGLTASVQGGSDVMVEPMQQL